jgi:tetratricopeptide (TPR) repeat protein
LFAQTGGIQGACKSEKGEPLVGNPILIERQEVKGVYKTKTDKHGKYIYIGLPLGNYKVTIQDPNGRPLFNIAKHVGMGDPTDVDFDLQKERAQQQQANPEIQKKLEEQQKEQKQSTSLKQIFDQGTELYNEKKFAEAAAMYEQAVPLAKGNNVPIVMGRLGDSYAKAKQYDKAVQTYQFGIQANPQDFNLHNNLGNVYADMGKIPEAQAEFQKAAEADPRNASRAYFNLGVVMYNKGRMDEAATALKKATEVDANYADAYFYEGQALFGKASVGPDGKIAPAPGTAEAFQQYLKLEPTGAHVAEAQAVLQTLESTVQMEVKVEKKKKKG